MNERQISKKLTYLRSVHPNQQILTKIRQEVAREIDGKDVGLLSLFWQFFAKKKPVRSYRFSPLAITLAIFVVFFLFGLLTIMSGQVNTMVLYGKLAAATNQYQRAQIAFTNMENTHNPDQLIEKDRVKELSYSLALANTEMAKLRLKGEPGKYTARQCRNLYRQYLNYLDELSAKVPLNDLDLASQVHDYSEQAEQKLDMYRKL